jgi:hypothetical protein
VREIGRIEIDAAARSLVWVDDGLYDVAAGWRRLPLDGSAPKARYSAYGAGFDAAVTSPERDLVALVQTAGTWSCVMVYDLVAALDNPARLDSYGDVFDMRGLIQAEISGACFAGDDVVVSTSTEPNDPDGPDDLGPSILARWSITDRRFVWKRQLPQTAGDLLPLAGGVLGLYQHPRLYDVSTGELAHEWPDLPTGTADSSIVWDKTFSGPARVAVDESNNRFAVTDGDRVTVITWS